MDKSAGSLLPSVTAWEKILQEILQDSAGRFCKLKRASLMLFFDYQWLQEPQPPDKTSSFPQNFHDKESLSWSKKWKRPLLMQTHTIDVDWLTSELYIKHF